MIALSLDRQPTSHLIFPVALRDRAIADLPENDDRASLKLLILSNNVQISRWSSARLEGIFPYLIWMLMISPTVVQVNDRAGEPALSDRPQKRPGFVWLFVLAAWCGLVAGLLEVGTMVVRKRLFDADQFFKMSRQFIWLVPLANMIIFLVLGVLGSIVIALWPKRGRWLVIRALAALGVLPMLLVAGPRIFSLAWLVVALGIAAHVVPLMERRARLFWRVVVGTLPAALTVVAILAASLWWIDLTNERREAARPLPPREAPNVLLIVMDTVAASHTSLHGYERTTSTTLEELGKRGFRFDSARATSSWTLPSHASLFTGKWLHELSVGWLTPLDREKPTLAEYLGKRGYATAGFVANTFYCATDSGLARGFTRYEDWLDSTGLFPLFERVWRALDNDRKDAAIVNRELLGWLASRPDPDRPFFAFLNYYDAHYPYQLPPGRLHRFGAQPTDNYQRYLIRQWRDIDKTTVSPDGLAFALDAYDDCIGDLDEQLGVLYDKLVELGILERTWLIITSDHGESFGEHPSIFGHGASLYDTEVRVPFLVIPPGGSATPRTVTEAVSLRDLAATIVDIAGQAPGSPFPGASLARFWKQTDSPGPALTATPSPSLSELVPNESSNRDHWGTSQQLSPLAAVKQNDWSYIYRNGDAREELFNLHDDPKEQRNRKGDSTATAELDQMRAILGRLTRSPPAQH
jgi:arylsulfatase A-like enzyme